MPTANKDVVGKGLVADLPYPELKVIPYIGENAMTVETMKQLLGWEEVKDAKSGTYHLWDNLGNKVRLKYSSKNRWLQESWARTLAQDILNRRWRFNGETFIVGKSGQVLSGQHRGVGLILAEQDRTGPRSEHWATLWKGPITLETLVVVGMDESEDVLRTIDNVKPKSLADVLFLSGFFGKASALDRQKLCRMMDQAIRVLWLRTGTATDPFAPRRTHSEALDFLARHSRVKDAAKHIFEEDDDSKIGRYISAGYAAGLMYLMGCSNSDHTKYATSHNEGVLSWTNWDKACEFWVLLAAGDEAFKPLRWLLSTRSVGTTKTDLDPEDVVEPSMAEKTAILASAWQRFVVGGNMSAEFIRPKYRENEDGLHELDEDPKFGGIDLGGGYKPPESHDPTPEELEQRKADERERRSTPKDPDRPKVLAKPPTKPQGLQRTVAPDVKKTVTPDKSPLRPRFKEDVLKGKPLPGTSKPTIPLAPSNRVPVGTKVRIVQRKDNRWFVGREGEKRTVVYSGDDGAKAVTAFEKIAGRSLTDDEATKLESVDVVIFA